MKQEANKIQVPFSLRFQPTHSMKSNSLSRLEINDKKRKITTFLAKKQQIQSDLWQHHIVQKNIAIQTLIKRYHALCIYYKIPQFYSYFFILHLISNTQSLIQQILTEQINQMKEKKISYFQINNSIQARQSCITQLSRCLENLFNTPHEQSVLKSFQEKIQHYRRLTIYVIDHIRKWKDYLCNISEEKQFIQYQYKGQNYLSTLINDNTFIFRSFLSNNVKLSQKNDPFLMKPYIDGGTHQYVKLFDMSQEERIDYLKYMNYLAQQKSKYIRQSEDTKQNKIKQIQDIYHSKTMNLSSFIIYRKLNIQKLQNQANRYEDNLSKKLEEFNIKTQRIKKIKASFRRTLMTNPRIQQNTKQQLSDNQRHKAQSVGLKKIHLNLKKIQEENMMTDFDFLTRKKQLQALKGQSEKLRKIKSKSISPLPYQNIIQRQSFIIKPKLNTFQIIPKKIVPVNEVDELNEQQNKINHSPEGILNHNEQIIVELRNKVLKQMTIQKQQKQRLERQRKQYDKSVEQFLKRKIHLEDLKDIKNKKQQKLIGKEQLAQSFKSKQLFGYKQIQRSRVSDIAQIQKQLKKEMQLKWLRDVQQQLKKQQKMEKHQKDKNQQYNKLSKEYQQAIKRQQIQKKYDMIQREQKAKIQRQQLQLDQKRKQQIENQMRQIIQKEKQKLQKFTIIQKLQIQQEMRQAMKIKILANLQQEKKKYIQQMRKQQALIKMEQSYRQQVRKKLEKQYNIKERLDRVKKMEEKQGKLKAINQKLDYLDAKIQEFKQDNKEQRITKGQMQAMKSKLTEFPDLRQSVFSRNLKDEAQKKQMREQFECELFAFRKPEIYHPQGQFLVKDFKTSLNDEKILNKKIQDFKNQQENIKAQINSRLSQKNQEIKSFIKTVKIEEKESEKSQNFVRFSESDKKKTNNQQFDAIQKKFNQDLISEQHRIKLGMSVQEYEIYMKKKEILSLKRNPDYQQQKERFLKKQKPQQKVEDFQIMNLEESNKMIENYEISFNQSNFNNIQQQFHQIISENKSLKQQNIKQKQNQKIKQKPKQDNFMVLETNKSAFTISPKKRFLISDDDEELNFEVTPKKRKTKHPESKRSVSKKSKYPQQKQEQIKPSIKHNITKMRLIPFLKLDEFIEDHWNHLPKSIRKTSIHKKQLLIKLIKSKKAVYIIQVIKDSQSLGLCICVFNENKKTIRSIEIIHLGSYNEDDYFELLQSSIKYIFENDPCQQISLSNCYDKQVQEEYNFILKFEKLFDPIGSIFQKKIINTQFERKYVLRRLPGSRTPMSKNSSNLGTINITNNLIKTNKAINNMMVCSLNQKNTGYYGILAHNLSKNIAEEVFSKIINDENMGKTLKYLSKTAKSIKQSNIECLKEIKSEKYPNFFQFNLQRMKKGKQILKVDSKNLEENLDIEWVQFQQNLQIKYEYTLTHHTIRYLQDDYQLKYLKYKFEKQVKSFTLQSSIFSTTVTILPCTNPSFRIFILDSQQFQAMNKDNPTSLDVYMKVFFNNVCKHSLCSWQNIYIPEFEYHEIFNIDEGSYFEENIMFRQQVNFSYLNYLGNSIVFKPTHRDLIITPPFIIGIMNVQLQQICQGSPLYIKKVTIDDLYEKHLVKKELLSD